MVAYESSIRNLDFETFDNWATESQEWGYLMLPPYVVKLLSYIRKRESYCGFFIKILRALHIPSLQCAATRYIPWQYLNRLISRCLDDKVENSILWALLTIWKFQLKEIGEKQSDIQKWIKTEAASATEALCSKIINQPDRVKSFLLWLFSNQYRRLKTTPGRVNVDKDICYLIEANMIMRWNDIFYDKTHFDIDYLTFLSQEVYHINKYTGPNLPDLLASYHRSIDDKFTSLDLDLSDNEIERVYGYGNAFLMANSKNIIAATKEDLKKYHCHFDGWLGRTSKTDYTHISKECFIISGLATMLLNNSIKDSDKQIIINDLIVETIRLCRNCGSIYKERLVMPFVMLRSTLFQLANHKALNDLDARLLKEVSDLTFVMRVFEYTLHLYPLSLVNKNLFRIRWEYEKSAIEAEEFTKGSGYVFSNYIKLSKQILT